MSTLPVDGAALLAARHQKLRQTMAAFCAPSHPSPAIRRHALALLLHSYVKLCCSPDVAIDQMFDAMGACPGTDAIALRALGESVQGGIRFELVSPADGGYFGVPMIPVPADNPRVNWRWPIDDGGQPLMVAYDLKTEPGKAYAAKFGKLLQRAYEGQAPDPHRTAILLYLGGELGGRWAAAALARKVGASDPDYRLVVSADPSWFELAYRAHNGFESCMKRGKPVLVTDREAALGRKRLALANPHMRYYYEVVNGNLAEGEAPRVRQAILLHKLQNPLGAQKNRWQVVARCLVWRVKTPDGEIQYADRPYGQDLRKKEMLNAKLLLDGVATYAKSPNASCHEALRVHDKGGAACQTGWLREWEVPGVRIDPTSPVAYGDTFKFYDAPGERLVVYGPRRDDSETNLEHTAETFGNYWERCHKCSRPTRRSEGRRVANPRGPVRYYCPECAAGAWKTCQMCGCDHPAVDTCVDEESGLTVCPSCQSLLAAGGLARCETCRRPLLPSQGIEVVLDEGETHRFCSSDHVREAGWRRCGGRCGKWQRASRLVSVIDGMGHERGWCPECAQKALDSGDFFKCDHCGALIFDSLHNPFRVLAYDLTGETSPDGILELDRDSARRIDRNCAAALGYREMWTGFPDERGELPHRRFVRPKPQPAAAGGLIDPFAERGEPVPDHDGALAMAQEGGAI